MDLKLIWLESIGYNILVIVYANLVNFNNADGIWDHAICTIHQLIEALIRFMDFLMH